MVRYVLLAGSLLLSMGAACGTVDPCDLNPDTDGDGEDSVDCGGSDCDDRDPLRFPGNTEVCDAFDNDCDPSTFGDRDADGDGYVDIYCINYDVTGGSAFGNDCDDASPDVHPALAEVCDSRDNDCDGAVDEGVLQTMYQDQDGDGFGDGVVGGGTLEGCALHAGYSFVNSDCDDLRSDRNPGLLEICDGVDNDCSGETDEGVLQTFYVDADQDGFGVNETAEACALSAGYSVRLGDCDDTNPALGNGSMRCTDASHYQVCEDGAWSAAATCPTQACLAEPNGAGICR